MKKSQKKLKTYRTVVFGSTPSLDSSSTYCSNYIKSTRYTWYNFVFKNLYEQFHNLANIYFFLLALSFLLANTSNQIVVTFSPLTIVIAIAMLKDGIEDIGRYKADRALNAIKYQILVIDDERCQLRWVWKKASAIRVGNVIRCENDDAFPCDMIILASSNFDGQVGISTVNLDGESNIKSHMALNHTQDAFGQFISNNMATYTKPNFDKVLQQLYIKIVCENPVANLNQFEGTYLVDSLETAALLNMKNLLVRGAKLKHTDDVIGIAIYTGQDTKLSLNTKQAKRKYSSRYSVSNKILLFFLIVVLLSNLLLAIPSTVWLTNNTHQVWYIFFTHITPWRFVRTYFRFCYIVNYFIPISIIVTLEIQQILLAFFISYDMDMYNPTEDWRAKANNTQLADELGQVEFLFTDKTGTLTQNSMDLTELVLLQHTDGINNIEHVNIKRYLTDAEYRDKMEMKLNKFLLMAALCHTISAVAPKVPTKSGSNQELQTAYMYDGTSSDEKAIVQCAAKCGVVFAGKKRPSQVSNPNSHLDYVIESINKSNQFKAETFHVDAILEFDSVRKRMSVMVRHPDNSCHVHSKGAELVMLDPKLCKSSSHYVLKAIHDCTNALAAFSLRTLIYSTRRLTKEKYDELLDVWNAAQTLNDETDRQHAIKVARSQIECHMEPVCVTGIEDELQPGVKLCINDLRKAGIKVWVLTGDKTETALAVSHSVGHFTDNTITIRLTHCSNLHSTASKMFSYLDWIKMGDHQHGLTEKREPLCIQIRRLSRVHPEDIIVDPDPPPTNRAPDQVLSLYNSMESATQDSCLFELNGMSRTLQKDIGLVVDGQSIVYLTDPSLRSSFVKLCMSVSSVVCCRLTPIQKSLIVQLVQTEWKNNSSLKHPPVIAAIGDGGNDVSMLLQANIGVAVYGKEGREAVRASDYALPEFRYLSHLLLKHGHWANYRITYTMLFFYHKCTAFVSAPILFIFFSGYSGTSLFGVVSLILFNMTMTSVINLFFGMFEKHLSRNVLLNKPALYRSIGHQANLKPLYVIGWVVEGIWLGFVAYFAVHLILAGGQEHLEAAFYQSGEMGFFDFTLCSNAVYIYLWTALIVRSILWTKDLNWMIWLGVLITLANLVILFIYERLASISSTEFYSYTKLASSPAFWFGIPLTTLTANLPALIWRIFSDSWWIIQIEYGQILDGVHIKSFRDLKNLSHVWIKTLGRQSTPNVLS